ncbi:MAG TPA: prepilin-type N-terminal cleavage/methylation domain-containing protein [Tepidisphaeraceae bacterium]|jgi:prepilin-type N-terminal cleavage/methylation domain-containing protein|nr:prepilin-type N-terminal cleavage/methylation domain-containing protein [Tepidisphaeraceae bacterium]
MIQHRTHPAGFTLIELMVSIAIALLLILGVNQVFKISSETAGQGQALSTINRDNRAIQNTLAVDLKNLVPVAGAGSQTADGPFFIIDSRMVAAFRNARDLAGAGDPADPLHDLVIFKNSLPVNGYWNPALINFRNHRLDRMGFFARGVYARQTAPNSGLGTRAAAGNGTFVSPGSASEAYIWYGHGMLPNPSNAYFGPGETDPANTSNRVAADFFLCREAILLTPTPQDPNFLVSALTANVPLAPLGYGSPSNDNSSPNGGAYLVQDSRYDVGITSIQLFSTQLTNYANSNASTWWYPLLYDPNNLTKSYRFKADPFLTRPSGFTGAKVTPDAMAKASPCLVRGCSQFIVEYAGNFYTKNADGTVKDATNPDPSGQVDFLLDNGVPKIRWYGFPRDTNGDGIIDARDVVPLRDFIGTAADAEHFSNNFPTTPPADYAAAGGLPAGASYTAAWGPFSKMAFPKMIRITVAIDDPNGRLSDAQFFEYVFEVQQ